MLQRPETVTCLDSLIMMSKAGVAESLEIQVSACSRLNKNNNSETLSTYYGAK